MSGGQAEGNGHRALGIDICRQHIAGLSNVQQQMVEVSVRQEEAAKDLAEIKATQARIFQWLEKLPCQTHATQLGGLTKEVDDLRGWRGRLPALIVSVCGISIALATLIAHLILR